MTLTKHEFRDRRGTDQALAYDPVVLAGVNTALANADAAMATPNRQGCPAAAR